MSIFKAEKLAAPTMSGPVLWAVHLSDVHFRDPRIGVPPGKAHSRFMHALRDFMKSWRASFRDREGLDAVFITGDLTYQCGQEDLERARELIPHILDAARAPGSRLYVVPGEHDIYLKYDKDRDHEMRFPDPETWNQVLEDERKGRRQKVESRLSNYHELLRELGMKHGTRVPCGAADIYYADAFAHEGKKVGVLGLNTAWSCTCRLDEDQGQLYLGEYQVRDAYRIVRRTGDARDADFTIGLLHHPLEWITEGDREAVELLTRGTDIFFRGHMHAGGNYADPERKKIPVLSASSWASSELTPGFLVAAIALDERKAYAWPYLWDGSRQEFNAFPGPGTDGGGPSFYSFDLGREHGRRP